jgi:hypothetical protein
MFSSKSLVFGSLVVGGLVLGTAGTAKADRVSFGLNIGAPVVADDCRPAGHYEERTVNVLVTPGHYESRFCPPTRSVSYDRWGRRIEITNPGHYDNVWVEPVYTTRCERVWVPDPVVVEPRPAFSFGFGIFGGGHDRHHHGHDRW